MAESGQEKQVSIIADSRESRAGIAAKLAQFPGVTVTQKELSSGDYVIGESVAVERKDASDLILSVLSGHLFDQVARLKTEYDSVVVLIENDPYATRSAIEPEAIDGVLSWLTMLAGVQVIHSPSLTVTPRLLWRLALHVQHGLGYIPPIRAGKPNKISAIQEYLVAGLPGVGPAMAKKLLAHFSTPAALFSASAADLRAVKGVGEKTAITIIEALTHKS